MDATVNEIKNVGIVGLGLIGGSMAKAIQLKEEFEILAYDTDEDVIHKAISQGMIAKALTDENIGECQMLIVALYPQETIEFITEKKHLIQKDAIVLDCCGVKRRICRELEPIALQEGFNFIGGHPMAGIEYSGYDYARADLFEGASMILCLDEDKAVARVAAEFFKNLGFGKVVFSNAVRHDKLIAYTSQLAHITSNAFVKSEMAERHKGFSAGSYLDLTRVAKLNPTMWTELFLENKDFLSAEIDGLIKNLELYKKALVANEKEELHKLLDEGSKRKKAIDK